MHRASSHPAGDTDEGGVLCSSSFNYAPNAPHARLACSADPEDETERVACYILAYPATRLRFKRDIIETYPLVVPNPPCCAMSGRARSPC